MSPLRMEDAVLPCVMPDAVCADDCPAYPACNRETPEEKS